MMDGLKITGIDEQTAVRRRRLYGGNVIADKKRFGILKVLVRQWRSPLIWILALSVLITGLQKDYIDSVMILIALLLNTVIGFIQEFRVEKSLQALKSSLGAKAEVIREGKRQVIDALLLVPGDIIFVSNEHKVAADGVIIESDNLQAMEAMLTGESAIVGKVDWQELAKIDLSDQELEELKRDFQNVDDSHKVFMGTEVKAGVAKVLVINTGMETQMGKIAGSLKTEKEEKIPLQKKIDGLTRILAIGVLVIALMVLVSGLATGKDWRVVFPLAIALGVAALPEGLSLSLTVVLALGMKRILAKGGIIRHLAVAESLSSVDVICIDKTGTLTEGEMKVTQALTNLEDKARESDLGKIVTAAILCNDLRDPLELAMDVWGRAQLTVARKKEVESFNRLDSRPFNSKEKLIWTLHEKGSDKLLLVSGAPEVVLARTNSSKEIKERWEAKFKELARQGYRLVGFAGKETAEGNKIDEDKAGKLEWIGIVVYEDPVRAGVGEALTKIVKAGIDLKVITGDYKETAAAVLLQIGLLSENQEEKILTGPELEKLGNKELAEKIDEIILFARINPEQKLRIVEALQSQGRIVAMTGDGVNDAPAIKKADIGIVVAQATEVAKETSDLVLVKNSFQTIVDSVEEGRSIVVNFRKVMMYLMADALAGVVVVLGALVSRWPLPLMAAQILWIKLVSDGFPYLALTVEPRERGLLKQLPSDFSGRILTPKMAKLMMTISLLSGAAALAVFGWFNFELGSSLEKARTMAMVMLGANSLTFVFSTRSIDRPIWDRRNSKNRWLWAAVALGWLLLLAVVYIPVLASLFGLEALVLSEWWWIFAGVVTVISGVEIAKLLL